MFNKCLIVDTETGGIDPKLHRVIEIGATLFDIKLGEVLGTVSMIIPAEENEAEEINHITLPMLKAMQDQGSILKEFGGLLYAMLEASDVVIAHQASFDKDHLTAEDPAIWSSKPWLCTREDFRFTKGKPGDSLVNTALAHGVPVHDNHRAGTDIGLLAKIFRTYTPEQLQDLFRFAALPRGYYVALTGYAEKDKPKSAGFTWNGDKRVWWKKLTEQEAAGIQFPIKKVEYADVSR